MWGITLDDLKGPQVKRARRLLNSKPGMPPSIALCVGALAIFFLGWSPTRVWSAEVEVTSHETDNPGTAQTAPDTNPNASASLPNVTPEGKLLGPPIIPFYFNWRTDNQTEVLGVLFPMFYSESHPSGNSRTLLLPFYYSSHDSWSKESSFHLYPLLYFQSGSQERLTQISPLHCYSRTQTSRDYYVVPLLSRFGSSVDGSVRRDILFPLYHHHYGPKFSNVWSLPLFTYSRTPEIREWSIFWFLYRQAYYVRPGRTAHSVLYPLGRFEAAPDGTRGHHRMIPFYWDHFNEESRFRAALPLLYLNYQSRNNTETTWDFTYLAPTYLGWGSPDDYFGMGFPIYWHSRTGSSSWYLFLPLHFSFFTNTSHGFHLFPIFSNNDYPSENLYAILGPTLILRSFYDFQGKREGFGFNLAWPFTAFESRPERYHYRLFPLFWTSRNRDERDLMIFPWYRQWGGDRSQNYFIPIYGNYRSKRLDRSFYALGSYIYSEEKGPEGEITGQQHDVLWPLLSFQRNDKEKSVHQRILPIGYWNSTSPNANHTLASPFYYEHRIRQEDKIHRLNLYAGNLFLSKTVHKRNLMPLTRKESTKVEDSSANSSDAETIISKENGILWPMVRWGEGNGRSSEWVAPVYFHSKTQDDETFALFPFLFADRMNDRYRSSLARYLFLLDIETWPNGHRHTVGQLLWDWMSEESQERYRWRLLYPFLEFESTNIGYRYLLTPIIRGSSNEEGGQKVNAHFLFPLYWFGSTQKKDGDTFVDENRYLYVFPFFGVNQKTLRTQYDVLLPFFHMERGINSFQFQLRPFFFYRDDPAIHTARLWPLYSYEQGEGAGNWWVSKYLFLAKSAVRAGSQSHRLDPLLFRFSRSENSFELGALFNLLSYDSVDRESEFRALPLAYGYQREKEAGTGLFPLYYFRNSGNTEINYWNPLRFLFLSNVLEGAGFKHHSFLGGLYSNETHANRPSYRDLRFLHGLVHRRTTESVSQYAFYPFFRYWRDDATLQKSLFLLFPPYRYTETAGQGTHHLFWFLRITE